MTGRHHGPRRRLWLVEGYVIAAACWVVIGRYTTRLQAEDNAEFLRQRGAKTQFRVRHDKGAP